MPAVDFKDNDMSVVDSVREQNAHDNTAPQIDIMIAWTSRMYTMNKTAR